MPRWYAGELLFDTDYAPEPPHFYPLTLPLQHFMAHRCRGVVSSPDPYQRETVILSSDDTAYITTWQQEWTDP